MSKSEAFPERAEPRLTKPDCTNADSFQSVEGKVGPEPTERYRNLLFKQHD
ncbi:MULTISPECIES: hypothetical protein [unclassified Pedobacter]|uniref:hypothetical protein n=1 Tax=unclassified Pedobacter TaxID=2628915 RepID=UPI00141D851A|nr:MULTISPECIES: hypothetical protein [unclassified Pedobacter]NII85333.1 hypothetical protein [Pedobacter sp. SG908]NMN39752.1 hypothetical protein [Pedobacter sp. SG918]